MVLVVRNLWKALRCSDGIVIAMGIETAIMEGRCSWMTARVVARPHNFIVAVMIADRRALSNLVLWTWTNRTLVWALVPAGLVVRCPLFVRIRATMGTIEIVTVIPVA